MSAWKPGDVALVHNEWGVWNVAICSLSAGHKGFVWRYGVSDVWGPVENSEARPLVVIDPEDTNDLAHDVARRLGCRPGEDISHIKEALKGALTPTPPRPDEPTGLGAVVENAEGERYVRCQLGNVAPWRAESPPSEDRPWRYYKDLAIVTVLSEGVS